MAGKGRGGTGLVGEKQVIGLCEPERGCVTSESGGVCKTKRLNRWRSEREGA